MIAQERGRNLKNTMLALALVGAVGASPAFAQPASQSKARGQAPAANPAPTADPNQASETPRLVPSAIPANPSDPICIINNQVITREQLAHECIVRKGEEI